ncbi:MAG: M20/M25/M40 family metallo-hydrolase [Acidobacteriaceae bacterium]|nr:M20/M25/M40 family metallo-hydrolase [Acidobacteriaceae bacterium]MBV9780636.1 M20/M25/M40 family metallo-hydrolase [Acidobacteriaceae bacterium]
MRSIATVTIFLCATLLCLSRGPGSADEPANQLARDILKQLVETNTTDSVGSTTVAAEAMAQRFREVGFPKEDVVVLGPNERKGNMVVRLRGTGAYRPILLIGHLDVVEARREDWTTDPFTLVEKDGYFYGRGTQDMKGEDAIFVTTLLRFKKEGYKPDRDIILALTADEEGGNFNGIDWLLKNHRELIDAEFVLNGDGGGVNTENGKPVNVSIDASEKLYADYELTVTNAGGHSSLPVPDNAIYHLADALSRLERHSFPFELNNVTRAYFGRMATVETGQKAADMKAILKNPPDPAAIERLSADPNDNATFRTTCVATRLEAGHANNALPQTARANVNCRILPGHSREEIRQTLIGVFRDPKITVRYVATHGESPDRALAQQSFPPVPLRPDVMHSLEQIAAQMWPGAPVIPTMATGASDAVYTTAAGLPTYGISGIAIDMDDVRAHGKDERIRTQSFYDGLEFRYRYLKALTSAESFSKPDSRDRNPL